MKTVSLIRYFKRNRVQKFYHEILKFPLRCVSAPKRSLCFMALISPSKLAETYFFDKSKYWREFLGLVIVVISAWINTFYPVTPRDSRQTNGIPHSLELISPSIKNKKKKNQETRHAANKLVKTSLISVFFKAHLLFSLSLFIIFGVLFLSTTLRIFKDAFIGTYKWRWS